MAKYFTFVLVCFVLPLCHSFLHAPVLPRRPVSALAHSLAWLPLQVCRGAKVEAGGNKGARSLEMFQKDEPNNAKNRERPERRPTTILLVRHGETEWNTQGRWQGQQDSPLTEEGEQQARSLGQRLKESGLRINNIYTSDLLRAFRSAEYICEAIGFDKRKMYIDKRMRERSFGIFEGKTRADVAHLYPEQLKQYQGDNPDFAIEGAESRTELLKRSLNWLETIGKHHEGETTLVMTHGAVVSCLIRHMLSIPYDPKPMADLRIRNTCMCELQREPGSGRWALLTIGDVAHTERDHIREITTTVEQETLANDVKKSKSKLIGGKISTSMLRKLVIPVLTGILGFLIGNSRLMLRFFI